MKKLSEAASIELTIEKSRFLGFCMAIRCEDEVESHIKAIRKLHHKADHVCSAWRVGLKQPGGHYSDDGEPSQTAGLPMYQYLEHHDLTDVLVLAVRYFGGIKLGTGGLVRAYTETARQALQAARWSEVKPCHRVEMRYPYTYQKLVMLEMQKELQAAPNYGEHITHVFYIEDLTVITALNDKLNGQLEVLSSTPLFVGISPSGIEELGGRE